MGAFLQRLNIVVYFLPLTVLVTLAYLIAAPFISIGMVYDGARRHWND